MNGGFKLVELIALFIIIGIVLVGATMLILTIEEKNPRGSETWRREFNERLDGRTND